MQQEQTPKEKVSPTKRPISSAGATCESFFWAETPPRANCHQLYSALRLGVTPSCAWRELSQPVTVLSLVQSPWSFLLPQKKKKKRAFISMAGARGGRGSTTVCLVKYPTVHFFSSLCYLLRYCTASRNRTIITWVKKMAFRLACKEKIPQTPTPNTQSQSLT